MEQCTTRIYHFETVLFSRYTSNNIFGIQIEIIQTHKNLIITLLDNEIHIDAPCFLLCHRAPPILRADLLLISLRRAALHSHIN